MVANARATLHEAAGAARTGAKPEAPIDPERVVGIVGADVPEEIIRAAGLHPYRLTGAPGAATPHADAFMERAVDPVARSILERLLDGTYAWLRHVALCHDSEATVRLYQYLREIRRIEPDRELPEPAFVEVLHQPARTSTAHTRRRLEGFTQTAGAWGGTTVDAEALRAAIAASNRRRTVIDRLSARRADLDANVSGVDALATTAASSMFSDETFELLVADLIDEHLDAAAAGEPPVRVFVTGSAQDAPGWYAGIESAGALVVGEDHAWGTAALGGTIAEDVDPLTALATFYQHRIVGSPRVGIRRRAAATVAGAVAAGAEAVVCLLRHEDPAPHWDVPAQRAGLEAAGIPLHVMQVTGYLDAVDDEQRASLTAFLGEVVEARPRSGRSSSEHAVREVRR